MGCLWSSQPCSHETLQEEVYDTFRNINWKELPRNSILAFFRPLFADYLRHASADDLVRVLSRLDMIEDLQDAIIRRAKIGLKDKDAKETEEKLFELHKQRDGMVTRAEIAKMKKL